MFGGKGDGQEPRRVFTGLVEELAVHVRHPRRRAHKALPVGVLTDGGQELADRPADPIPVDRSADVSAPARARRPMSLMDGAGGEKTPQPATRSRWLSGQVDTNVGKVAVALGDVEAVAHDELRLDIESDVGKLEIRPRLQRFA